MATAKLYSKAPPPSEQDEGFYVDQELSKIETAFTQVEQYVASVGTAVDQTARDDLATVKNRVTTLEVTNGNASAAITQEQLVRISEDEALAQQILTLRAELNQNTAQLQVEQTARVTADQAMAQQVTTLEANFNQSSASFQQTITAIATDQYALSQQVAIFSSQVGLANARIQEETTARTTADEAFTQQITTLTATLNQNYAGIQTQLTALVNKDQALTTSIQTLQTQFNTNSSNVQNQIESLSNANGAQARQTSILYAVAGQKQSFRQDTAPVQLATNSIWYNTAYLDQPYRWDGTKWNELVPGTYTGPAVYNQDKPPQALSEGDLWFKTNEDNKCFRWSGSSWQETTDTRIANALAQIATEATVRANADGALAQTQSTLSTQFNGLSNSVSTVAQSVDGIKAKWGVRINNNGAVSGIELNSGADSRSVFKIQADRFQIEPQAGGAVQPFYVEGNTTYIENAVIKNGSLTQVISAETADNDIVVYANLKAGSRVVVIGEFIAGAQSETYYGNSGMMYIHVNGNAIMIRPLNIYRYRNNGFWACGQPTTHQVAWTCPADGTYSFWVANRPEASGIGSTITVIENRK